MVYPFSSCLGLRALNFLLQVNKVVSCLGSFIKLEISVGFFSFASFGLNSSSVTNSLGLVLDFGPLNILSFLCLFISQYFNKLWSEGVLLMMQNVAVRVLCRIIFVLVGWPRLGCLPVLSSDGLSKDVRPVDWLKFFWWDFILLTLAESLCCSSYFGDLSWSLLLWSSSLFSILLRNWLSLSSRLLCCPSSLYIHWLVRIFLWLGLAFFCC